MTVLKPRCLKCAAVVLGVLLLANIGLFANAMPYNETNDIRMNQTTPTSFEVIQYPYLEDGVEPLIHGTSDEFNVTHVSTGTVSSYVNLTWSHVAGTELATTSSELPFTTARGDYPYYWDFCYFTISFPWLYERMPTDAMFYLSFGVTTRGDFNTSDGIEMFDVYSWLITSADSWNELYIPEPPHTITSSLHTYDLNYFDLVSWRGMIADESGVQEDPEDNMRVGVGLAPSENFESYDDTHPWQDYNGSVTVIVTTVSLVVELEPEDEGIVIDPIIIGGPVLVTLFVIVAYIVWRVNERKGK